MIIIFSFNYSDDHYNIYIYKGYLIIKIVKLMIIKIKNKERLRGEKRIIIINNNHIVLY